MTPYLMKVQDTVHAEDQFCCLLLAERVHSGYEGENLQGIPDILKNPLILFQKSLHFVFLWGAEEALRMFLYDSYG